ncbi:MAG: ribose-5-phosphate isomerase RpiA [Rhodospirillales bacterium]|nr:ribose-5-phosphate isomerase RpiA [Rhodospirillales bacterium]
MSGAEQAKRAAAEAAARLVEEGMLVGLGSGSTVRYLIEALGRRVREEGLSMVGIPTSTETDALALTHGITLAEPGAAPIALAIDGADEVERGTLRLIKGLGGALLREKIVAEAAARFVVIADASKVVERLGERAPLPVEVVRFGHAATARRLAELGGRPVLRRLRGEAVFVSDGGNVIYDCPGFTPIRDSFTLQRDLRAMAGVVETGLFAHHAGCALIGGADGRVTVMERSA